jgi:hypothetical protein
VKAIAACLGGAIACAVPFACVDAPTTTGAGAATTACAPLEEPGAAVTAEGLTADGLYVVVVSRAGGTRPFFGVAAHLVEGAVTGMHQGCALEIDFDVLGRTEVATFSPGPPACDVASKLTSGNAGDAIVTAPLTVLLPAYPGDAGDAGDAAPTSPRSALTFFCL